MSEGTRLGEWSIANGRLLLSGHQVAARYVLQHLHDDTGAASAFDKIVFSRFPVALQLEVLAGNDSQLFCRIRALHRGQSWELPVEPFVAGDDHAILASDFWAPFRQDHVERIKTLLSLAGLNGPGPIEPSAAIALFRQRRIDDPLQFLTDISIANLRIQGDAPSDLCAKLYPYQQDGVSWLRFLSRHGLGGILGDEMGLGKTLQVIALMCDHEHRQHGPDLVVCRATLLANWQRELKRFSPSLKVLVHHGDDRPTLPQDMDHNHVVLTSYETLVRDLAMLRMVEWNGVFVDEAQDIRNPDTRRARAVMGLRRRLSIAITGTPVENRLLDAWSIGEFALPGMLGSREEYESDPPTVTPEEVEKRLTRIMLRRRVAEVAQDLPLRIDISQALSLSDKEAADYERIRTDIWQQYGQAAGLVELQRLRMFCAHPWLLTEEPPPVDPKVSSTKYRRLCEILGEIRWSHEKAIIFVGFNRLADLMRDDLARQFGVFTATINGNTQVADRQPLIDRFSQITGPAFLILNPRAAGAGLNITAANHVIHYTLEWNPAVEDQASARAWRRGQERPVTVHRLWCEGTIDEVMIDRLESKRKLAAAAVVGSAGTEEDMRDLIRALRVSPIRQLGEEKRCVPHK